MATPYIAVQFDPHTRPLAFDYKPAERFDKRFYVGEHNRR